eukprot:3830203-Amphidinium_carterae.1
MLKIISELFLTKNHAVIPTIQQRPSSPTSCFVALKMLSCEHFETNSRPLLRLCRNCVAMALTTIYFAQAARSPLPSRSPLRSPALTVPTWTL